MSRKFIAFDIETAAEIPGPDFNWKPHRPIGITCAAAIVSGATQPIVWHGHSPDGRPSPRMTSAEARGVVQFLAEQVAAGYTLLTWNGLGFDFDVLAEESDAFATCRDLALGHVDMMFHIFCEKGFPVGLEKAAQALGIPGKLEGLSGWQAPQLWAQGEHQKVLEYVGQDVRVAIDVAARCEAQQSFNWLTQKGTVGTLPLKRGWLTVREALQLPPPDTSWMTRPMHRESFTEWLGA
ncbi:MAG: ribonuclease H-like domain-containing protein [Planctomycetes bacterium]|nr:ribonuclease H-like domain-containing protein [Planctomycetota bacterium]